LIVLDASAAIEWLLQTPTGLKIELLLSDPTVTFHAPHLLDLEVAQVLRKSVRERLTTEERGKAALEDFAGLRILRYSHGLLLPRIWQLRSMLTAYDAAYVALAEMIEAPLITCDRKLAAAHGHRATVEVVL
jgi:predicted nucleic acid-binding protein